jgi:hypothetical protein
VFVRQGSGPGEATNPEIVLQGDTLVVFDPGLLRLTRLSPSGKVLSERPLDVSAEGFPLWSTRDGSILVETADSAHGMNQSALRVRPSGKIDTVAWNERFADQQFVQWRGANGVAKGGPFSAAPQSAIDPDGHAVVGGSSASRWAVISERDTLQRVTLPDRPARISVAVRDSAWKVWTAKLESYHMADALHKELLPTTFPAWLTLDINPQGEWWVGRPGADGSLAAWDIVVNGKLVAHAAVPARVAGVHAFGNRFVALLHEDENDIPWIGVYRVVRSAAATRQP